MIIVRTVRALSFTREEIAAMAVAATFAVVLLVAGLHNVATTGQWGGGALPIVTAAVQPVAAVCSTDSECQAWDAAHGVVSDGGPGNTAPIVAVPVEDVSADCSDALLAAGYRGIPGDGQEAVYVPQDAAMSLCAGDADVEVVAGL